jgi:hypothetical protein
MVERRLPIGARLMVKLSPLRMDRPMITNDPHRPRVRPPNPAPRRDDRERENKSLDLVQRMIMSALVGVVFGSLSAVLALYLALRGDEDLPHASVVGLWIMTGLFGLATAAAVLLLNRRRPWSPWVLLGLLPMAVSGYWILT